MARGPKFLDVSVSLTAGIPAYPGNPEFELQPVKRISAGGSSNVSKLVMGTHTGTHVDAPKHFFDDGAGVDALALDLLIGRAHVVEITKRGGIGRDELAAAGLREDIRVLLKTSNSALWNGSPRPTVVVSPLPLSRSRRGCGRKGSSWTLIHSAGAVGSPSS